ncbi:hypothetical protein L3Q82_019918 [Scortum barcoo]|uniref:Uncharacterized protein n=1 Tax=Scortum barcoo TaxID=214431 RepID=A0ACB8VCN3_9TELE|nr:hypothetical protein L3Q82_019918 [Scortum barcoo]
MNQKQNENSISKAHLQEHQGPLRRRRIGLGVTGAPPWSQAWGWGSGERLVAGSLPVFAHGTRPGSARNGDAMGPPSSRLTTRRKVHEGPVQCGLGSSVVAGGLDDPIPGPKLWQ